jgi:hypothetical protein
MAEIQAPPAPSFLPPAVAEQWRKTWIKEFKQALIDHEGDETEQRAVANRAANRVLHPDYPQTYEEAMALPDWQCLFRGEKNGKLVVILISARSDQTHEDGKLKAKFHFDIPAKAAKRLAQESKNGNGGGEKQPGTGEGEGSAAK